MPPFRWSNRSELAAQLVAADDLTNDQIAERCGVSRPALQKWKTRPEFMARVDEHLEAYRQAVLRHGVAFLERRVAALDERWRGMRRIIDERAASPVMQGVPGGTTGLLVHTAKGLGGGESFRVVDEFTLDCGLLRELREHEKQAAQELGQWTEGRQVGGDEAGPFVDRHAQLRMLSSPRAVQLACDLDAEVSRPGVRRDERRGQAGPSHDVSIGSTQARQRIGCTTSHPIPSGTRGNHGGRDDGEIP